MISRLTGEIVLKRPPDLIVDVNGVGYEMQAPMSTFYNLPEPGERTTLLTHLLVRDDAHVLYAFASEYDRSLFRALLRISGIGAKIALAILSGMEPAAFKDCVLDDDVEALVRVPGVGRKTAERLVLEMKSRFNDDYWMQLGAGAPADKAKAGAGAGAAAVQALVSLGYKTSDARRMVKQADVSSDAAVEEIIKSALKSSLG